MKLRSPRGRLLARNAIRWHLTGFDATSGGGNDADGVAEHGLAPDEQRRFEAIFNNPEQLSDVLLRWVAFDEAEPACVRNESNQTDVLRMVATEPFFAPG